LGEEEKEIEERIDFERHPPPPLFILIRFMVEQLMPIPSYQVTIHTQQISTSFSEYIFVDLLLFLVSFLFNSSSFPRTKSKVWKIIFHFFILILSLWFLFYCLDWSTAFSVVIFTTMKFNKSKISVIFIWFWNEYIVHSPYFLQTSLHWWMWILWQAAHSSPIRTRSFYSIM